MHKQRERETFGFSQPGDRGLAFDVCGRWQPLMRISMATERLWLQIELAEPHLLRSTGREHQGPENTDGSCIEGAKYKALHAHFDLFLLPMVM